MYFYRFGAIVLPIVAGSIAVAVGFELRARLKSGPGKHQVRRADLRRNEHGGYDEEPKRTPA